MHTRHLSLELTEQPDALPRVVTLCRRRGAEIVSLSYSGADRHRPARLELALRTDDRRGRPLVANLRSMVDVRSVQEA
jgi:acetolactate synthase regulatory subunit